MFTPYNQRYDRSFKKTLNSSSALNPQFATQIQDKDVAYRPSTTCTLPTSEPKENDDSSANNGDEDGDCLDMDTLRRENKGLKQKLQRQITVNKELKGLLVGSFGMEMNDKVDNIIKEKTDAVVALDSVRKVLKELQSGSDIETNIWKSKFSAAHLLVVELQTNVKALRREINHYKHVANINNSGRDSLTESKEDNLSVLTIPQTALEEQTIDDDKEIGKILRQVTEVIETVILHLIKTPLEVSSETRTIKLLWDMDGLKTLVPNAYALINNKSTENKSINSSNPAESSNLSEMADRNLQLLNMLVEALLITFVNQKSRSPIADFNHVDGASDNEIPTGVAESNRDVKNLDPKSQSEAESTPGEQNEAQCMAENIGSRANKGEHMRLYDIKCCNNCKDKPVTCI